MEEFIDRTLDSIERMIKRTAIWLIRAVEILVILIVAWLINPAFGVIVTAIIIGILWLAYVVNRHAKVAAAKRAMLQ
jgi:Ca2+/H+ antiporter